MNRTVLFCAAALAVGTALAGGSVFRAECRTPARAVPGVAKSKAWEQSLLTGNGAMGAMVPGELSHEEIYLSHARIFLPRVMNGRYFELAKYRPLARDLALAGREREIWDAVIAPASAESGYSFKRDPFMAAAMLVVDTPGLPDFPEAPGYLRYTDFTTGECVVRMDGYERRLFASRPDGVLAMRVEDGEERPFTVRLDTVSNGRPRSEAVASPVREKDGFMYYRVDFKNRNGKNPFHGYEVTALRRGNEVFAKIHPLEHGVDTKFPEAKAQLSAAAAAGYRKLLERHRPVMEELMGRVELELPDASLVRKFHACRYNIISSTGPDGVIPNLQGLWAASWSAPYNGGYTVDGNLPCAMEFWIRGATPEFNESLYEWIMRYRDDFREAALKGYGARGIHIPGQVTTTGLETAYYPNVELMWWHGGAGWLAGFLWRWYDAVQDRDVLEKIHPILKDAADYTLDVLEEFPDGTLGFAPGYSPENAPTGGHSTQLNPTMDVSIAREIFDYTARAARILGRDEESVERYMAAKARLAPYQITEDGLWAEWLVPEAPDNSAHRHASHLYALFDEAPPEILTNAVFTAAIRKTIRRRMDFHETNRHMAFGVVQLALAAAKIGDAETVSRAVKLLDSSYFTSALGTLHDRDFLFNIDISGGFPAVIADSLITKAPGGGYQILPAKPAEWKSGRIAGLLLGGGVKLGELAWQGEDWRLSLILPGGRTVSANGAGRSVFVPPGAQD